MAVSLFIDSFGLCSSNSFLHASSLVLFSLFSVQSYAEGWETFSSHKKLKGYEIAEVGEITEVRPPMNETWNVHLYKINGWCFSFTDYFRPMLLGSSKAAFLLVKEPSEIIVSILESSIGSIKADVHPASIYKCPHVTTAAESVELLRKQIEQYQEQLKRQQK